MKAILSLKNCVHRQAPKEREHKNYERGLLISLCCFFRKLYELPTLTSWLKCALAHFPCYFFLRKEKIN